MSRVQALRWIPPLRLSGCWQMAIDAWLLDRAVIAATTTTEEAPPVPVLRFYSWSRPTLSLGHHQRSTPPRWLELARRGELRLVRRPSGGRAVLHHDELTYALIWPQAPARRREAYRAACAWLQEGFAELGLPLRFGVQAVDPLHPSCFAASTAADLVHPGGGKRIGSAQLWRRGVLLQHGSILLNPDGALWRRVFDEEPPALAPLELSPERLITVLRRAARRHLPIATSDWRLAPLSAQEWSAIASRRSSYQVDPFAAHHAAAKAAMDCGAELLPGDEATARPPKRHVALWPAAQSPWSVTSPELSIDRATGARASPSG